MKLEFQRVIIYARHHRINQDVSECVHRLITFLKSLAIETVLDKEMAGDFCEHLPVLARENMGEKKDLIVVVGGDGSLLSAARMALSVNVPVIGINRGRLGFLTDISPNDIEKQLGAVLSGSYKEEFRSLLTTRIHDENKTYYQGLALNDVVLGRGNETHLVEFDVYIDKQFVSHYRADGIILATPTGSTAYALSVGGPIVYPTLDTIVIVPLCSHSLSSRPLVIDGKSEVDLMVSERNGTDLRISCDGHESLMVKPGQVVHVEKTATKLRLLHPLDYHYYETLRIKLGWESKNQG